jgi:hypothetical protein
LPRLIKKWRDEGYTPPDSLRPSIRYERRYALPLACV